MTIRSDDLPEMDLSQRARQILNRLKLEFPDSRCTLDYRNTWELLVATILSAQCTDERVNRITPVFFKRFPDPFSTTNAETGKIEDLIRSAGLFRNKAKSIKSAAEVIVKNHGGNVPSDYRELIKIPGIGRKTANVILGVGFNIPAITVDTHVWRLSQRLKLTQNTDPVKIERDLMEIIPRDNWIALGHLFIDHGRKTCKAQNPSCIACILEDLCPFPHKT